MKNSRYILTMALAVLIFVACHNNYPVPEYVEPVFELADDETIISIEDLKARHIPGDKPDSIKDKVVVRGIVVGDDESGNIYKSLYIQDKTGGINFAIDHVNMYNLMPVGQEVYVRMKGLFIGDYNKGYQVGDTVTDQRYGLEMARYNWANELGPDSMRHFFLNGKPDSAKIPAPKIIESANAVTSDMYGSLVTLKNVTFPAREAEVVTWSVKEQNINRTARFEDGSEIIVRTSGYCNFYADTIPLGTGSITGILSLFGTTKQFYIRSRDDIGNFVIK